MASPSAGERPYDVVLLGATGFTGALTAEVLARRAGEKSTRWALAGRNRDKLAALAQRLGVDVPLLHADVDDAASLRELAESTRVVATDRRPLHPLRRAARRRLRAPPAPTTPT